MKLAPVHETTPRPAWRRLIVRAARLRCPQCGEGRLFRRFYTLHDRCPHCNRDFRDAEGNTWFFMYFSSAGIVGLFFLMLLFYPPGSTLSGWLTWVPAAAVVMLATLPIRKALAIAGDYYLDPSKPPGKNEIGHS